MVATLRVVAILSIVVFISLMFCSCESKSGHLASVPNEKVVILDSYPLTVDYNGHCKYKVKRISKGVVTYITDPYLYEQGDTIYHKFIN